MKLLCTLGPATFREGEIRKLTDLGANLFRINLSHTKAADLEGLILHIRQYTSVPICLDSEGAQIRTGDFREKSYEVCSGDTVSIPREVVLGERHCFNLYPLSIIDQLQLGTLVNIDFNAVVASVVKKDEFGLLLKIINGGTVGQNKAVTVDQSVWMDPLTEKDHQAMAIGRAMGIQHVALSFAHRAMDVQQMRQECLPGTTIISKIECLEGLKNLDEIIRETDEILIDRGDLSREVPIEQVPIWQKHIIKRTKDAGKPVYVATNLLETMVGAPLPTRAEINDIYNTLSDGASGLVLAAETAIGKFPIECAAMIKRVMATHNMLRFSEPDVGMSATFDFLPEPHGGRLVQNFVNFGDGYASLPQISLPADVLSDIEQIAHGTFSPLRGFMGEEEIQSVLSSNRLLDGTTWTVPVILQVEGTVAELLKGADQVVVALNGTPHSLLQIKSVKKVGVEKYLQSWFGTDDIKHPGVARVSRSGSHLVECEVFLFQKNQYLNHEIAFTPKQLRVVFQHLGWTNVVGFHTRNVPHAAHEFIQCEALRLEGADGVLISPVIGPKKAGDFETDLIFQCYDHVLRERNAAVIKFLLSGFNTYSRYAGPREAVFTALCRKNMGCSHFVVGRDHTGVGEYYPPMASQEIFAKIGDIGIKVICFPEIAYNVDHSRYEVRSEDGNFVSISGTEVRRRLQSSEPLPAWFMSHDVQRLILDRLQKGEKVFV